MNARPNCRACQIRDEIKAFRKDTSLSPLEKTEGIQDLRAELSKTRHEHPTRSKTRNA